MNTSIHESNESREETIFRAFAMLQDAFESAAPEDLTGGVYTEAARHVRVLLEAIADSGDAPEYLTECHLSGQAFGELLLQQLDPDLSIDKRKWLDVAEVLGPDHAQTLYHAAVFATKVA